MSFRLTLEEGEHHGKIWSFDAVPVVIGRTDDCEVMLGAAGVSRHHAVVSRTGTDYFVEDLGGVNGTQLNGERITKHVLRPGDVIGIGESLLRFEYETAQQAGSDSVIVEVTGAISVPADTHPNAVGHDSDLDRPHTEETPQADTSAPELSVSAEHPQTVEDEASPADTNPDVPKTAENVIPAPLRRAASGADWVTRLRARAYQLRVLWRSWSPRKRLIVAGIAVSTTVAVLTAAVSYRLLQRSDVAPEPTTVSSRPIEASFGYGEGVDYPHRLEKSFGMDIRTPVRAVALVKFQSKDISEGELEIAVNGVVVGTAPADTLNVAERTNEVLVPTAVIQNGKTNVFTFRSTKNKKSKDPWRVWNVWVDVQVLPEIPEDQLLSEAESTYQSGLALLERKSLAAPNLYQAWKYFRTAWLMLESLPDPKPDIYRIARDKVHEAQHELDRQCAKLILEAYAGYNLKQFDVAKAALEHVNSYFPGKDQPCPYKAAAIRDYWEL